MISVLLPPLSSVLNNVLVGNFWSPCFIVPCLHMKAPTAASCTPGFVMKCPSIAYYSNLCARSFPVFAQAASLGLLHTNYSERPPDQPQLSIKERLLVIDVHTGKCDFSIAALKHLAIGALRVCLHCHRNVK